MLFNTLQYALFFSLIVAAYYVIPHKWRWAFLLGASYYFYMRWNPAYIGLILLSTGVDYVASRQMARQPHRHKRRPYLALSLIANLGLLFTFKYLAFFTSNVNAAFTALQMPFEIPALSLLLPVGISFYTFQTLSYTIDVYLDKQTPEPHLGKFALFVAFFPQLVAGPIERSTNLLPQFHRTVQADYARFADGLRQILWGLFKKAIIADRVAQYVDHVYGDLGNAQPWQLIVAAYFFAFQIYCDFSGYSDMAIGSARILGFDLMQNFKTPYFASSIREFWGRWHISLSTWFRDYLYIPLGGNRTSMQRWLLNLFIVFLVSGFWHGANWTFIAWGAIHGGLIVFTILIGRIPQLKSFTLPKLLTILLTFHSVVLAWVFFRAASIGDAVTFLLRLLDTRIQQLDLALLTSPIGAADFWIAIIAIGVMLIFEYFLGQENPASFIGKQPTWLRWTMYYSALTTIIFFGVFEKSPFIYFQF